MGQKPMNLPELDLIFEMDIQVHPGLFMEHFVNFEVRHMEYRIFGPEFYLKFIACALFLALALDRTATTSVSNITNAYVFPFQASATSFAY